MTVRVRFAPSPTGKLHVGNVRTALMNVLFALEQGGTFILRIDDTDTERSTDPFEDGIKTDLAWLGFDWGKTFNQSDRYDLYEDAAKFLKEKGLLYPCYETAEELDRQRKILRAQKKPPVYNRAALELTDEQIAKYKAEGRSPHWRFKLSGKTVSWHDMVRGEQTVDTSSLSDPVLIRADSSYLYTLPSVVDDLDAEITHVIRGEDHVTNSGAQIEIFRALGGKEPIFAHTPLLVGADGKGLSKRLGSLSMDQLREDGIEPMAVCSLLAKIGTSDPVEARTTLTALAAEFSFDKIGRAPARFDEIELRMINGKLLHDMPFDAVKDRLSDLGVKGDDVFWDMARANIQTLNQAADWWSLVSAPQEPVIDDEDRAFLSAAADALPDHIDMGSWGGWMKTVKDQSGRKGKTLFMPLRLALTGQKHGPELDKLVSLMGVERAKARLRGETA